MQLNDPLNPLQKILFEDNSWKKINEFIANNNYTRVFILGDTNTILHCLPLIKLERQSYEVIKISAGESSKSIEVSLSIWSQLTDSKADRNALLINLGGGVVTDLGGFVASIYKRGIDFINVPTTLLAMIDAAIGGKCGIDFKSIKNQLGVFSFSRGTFINPFFLKTLEFQEIKSGFAEAIKHALIADKAYWNLIKEVNLKKTIPIEIINKSVEIKQSIVNSDPTEQGDRKKLNFGHTVGHALESHFFESGNAIPHGYAIAVGMICEAFIATKISGLLNTTLMDIVTFINSIYDPIPLSSNTNESILEYITQDKKTEGTKQNFTLLNKIGLAEINQEVDKSIIVDSLDYYRSLF